jgi:hypothetical protein
MLTEGGMERKRERERERERETWQNENIGPGADAMGKRVTMNV